MDEPSEHTVLKTKFTEVHQAYRRADVAFPLSIVHVVCFALERVTANVSGGASSKDPIEHTAKAPELQMKYDHFVTPLSSVPPECDTLHSLA